MEGSALAPNAPPPPRYATAFPPVSVTKRVLSKLMQDEAEGILVVPFWSNQVWYPVLFKMLISVPILLNSR